MLTLPVFRSNVKYRFPPVWLVGWWIEFFLDDCGVLWNVKCKALYWSIINGRLWRMKYRPLLFLCVCLFFSNQFFDKWNTDPSCSFCVWVFFVCFGSLLGFFPSKQELFDKQTLDILCLKLSAIDLSNEKSPWSTEPRAGRVCSVQFGFCLPSCVTSQVSVCLLSVSSSVYIQRCRSGSVSCVLGRLGVASSKRHLCLSLALWC